MNRWHRELTPTIEGVRCSYEFGGTHRGVTYEARATLRPETNYGGYHEPEKLAWCHYIYLHENACPADWLDRLFLAPKRTRFFPSSPERITYDYTDSALSNLEWHCGITFYDMVVSEPGHRVLKAGCDYQHLWDDGHDYNADAVIFEAKQTIDSLWEMVPGLLVRSLIDGTWSAPTPTQETTREA